MNEVKKKTRGRYDAEIKQQIFAQCAEPGASVAPIVLSHGINANVVHKLRRQTCGVLLAVLALFRSFAAAAGGAPICAGHPQRASL